MTTDDFTRGVNWGKFLVALHTDDIRTDEARRRVLTTVTDYLDAHPDEALRDAIIDAWFGYQCHGDLEPGEVCNECGMSNPGT